MIPSAYALAAPTVKRAMPRLAQYNKMITRSYAFPSNPVPIKFAQYGSIPRAHPEQVEKAVTDKADFGVFDVREAAVWDKEHISGTINIPLADLVNRSKEAKWERRREVYVFGTQAQGYEDAFQAYPILKDAGFSSVYVIESNIKDMVMSGFFYDAEKDIVW